MLRSRSIWLSSINFRSDPSRPTRGSRGSRDPPSRSRPHQRVQAGGVHEVQGRDVHGDRPPCSISGASAASSCPTVPMSSSPFRLSEPDRDVCGLEEHGPGVPLLDTGIPACAPGNWASTRRLAGSRLGNGYLMEHRLPHSTTAARRARSLADDFVREHGGEARASDFLVMVSGGRGERGPLRGTGGGRPDRPSPGGGGRTIRAAVTDAGPAFTFDRGVLDPSELTSDCRSWTGSRIAGASPSTGRRPSGSRSTWRGARGRANRNLARVLGPEVLLVVVEQVLELFRARELPATYAAGTDLGIAVLPFDLAHDVLLRADAVPSSRLFLRACIRRRAARARPRRRPAAPA